MRICHQFARRKKHWATLRRYNDHAYFVMHFAQLEQHVNDQCEKLIARQKAKANWTLRRPWDSLDMDRMDFMRRVSVLTEKGHATYAKVKSYYTVRNDICTEIRRGRPDVTARRCTGLANAGQSHEGDIAWRYRPISERLLDVSIEWKPTSSDSDLLEARELRRPGTIKWTGTRVDLIFGSHSQLPALAEVYGSADAGKKFVHDFVAAWDKVMKLDRFDLA